MAHYCRGRKGQRKGAGPVGGDGQMAPRPQMYRQQRERGRRDGVKGRRGIAKGRISEDYG